MNAGAVHEEGLATVLPADPETLMIRWTFDARDVATSSALADFPALDDEPVAFVSLHVTTSHVADDKDDTTTIRRVGGTGKSMGPAPRGGRRLYGGPLGLNWEDAKSSRADPGRTHHRAIGRLIVPGPNPIRFLRTIVAGLAGSFLAVSSHGGPLASATGTRSSSRWYWQSFSPALFVYLFERSRGSRLR